MELLNLHRVVYSCAGALLVLKSMPVVYRPKERWLKYLVGLRRMRSL